MVIVVVSVVVVTVNEARANTLAEEVRLQAAALETMQAERESALFRVGLSLSCFEMYFPARRADFQFVVVQQW